VEFEKSEFVTREGRIEDDKPVWRHEAAFDVIADSGLLTISIWDREKNPETFLGCMKVVPPKGKFKV
jgi:hypothetical protein